jgi:hypothetical protein
MIKIKPITLLLGGILAAGTIMSADARPYRHCGGWYVELEGFHARASDTLLSNLPYAVTEDFEDSFLASLRSWHVDPDETWGYRIAVGYDNPSCTCDYTGFTLEYTRWDHEEHDSIVNAIEEIDVEGTPVTSGAIDYVPISSFSSVLGLGARMNYTDASARHDIDYETLDFLGHKHKICPCYVDLDCFVGVRLIDLDQRYHAHYFVNAEFLDDFPQDFVPEDHIHIKSEFEGIGPRVGVNAFYCIGGGFGVSGELAASLLFGTTDSHYQEIFTLNDTIADDDLQYEYHEDHSDKAQIVPGLSGKVALAYRGNVLGCYKVDIELGWRGDKYYDIAQHSALVQAASGTNDLVLPERSSERNFDKHAHYHDFAIEGPYASISFHG